jgi:hypothetical protein
VGKVHDVEETVKRIVDARGVNYWDEFMAYVSEVSGDPEYVAGVFLGREHTDRLDYYLQMYADFIDLLLEELHGIRLRTYVIAYCGSSEYCNEYFEIAARKTIIVRDGKKYYDYELDVYSERGGIPYSDEEDFNRSTADLLERIRDRYRAIEGLMERAHVKDTGVRWEYGTE